MKTPEDVAASLLPSRIAQGSTPFGGQDVGATSSSITQAVGLVLLRSPRTYEGILFAGLPPLRAKITALYKNVTDLLVRIDRLGRRTPPLADMSQLEAALVTVRQVDDAAQAGAVTSIDRLPAYHAFLRASTSFLQGHGQHARGSGALALSPEQAAAEIPGLLRSLREGYAALYIEVASRSASRASLAAVNLPQAVVASTTAPVRALLETRIKQLRDMTPASRNAVLADLVLELLGSRASLKFLQGLRADPALATGTVAAYTDAGRPLTPASLLCDNAAPYVVPAGTSLSAVVNGETVGVTLDASYTAELQGFNAPSYVFTGSNNTLDVLYNGAVTPVTFAIATLTAEQVLAAAALSFPPEAQLLGSILPGRLTAPVSFAPTGPTTGVCTRLNPSTNFVSAGVVIGDKLVFRQGPMAAFIWTVTAVSASTITCSGGTAVVSAYSDIDAGPASDVRLRLRAASPTAVADRDEIGFSLTSPAAEVLGFVQGSSIQCTPTSAEALASQIRSRSTLLHAERAELSTVSVEASTSPADPRVVRFTRGYVRATIAAALGGLVATVDEGEGLASFPSLSPGDRLVIRSGPDEGASYVITSATASVVAATGAAPTPGVFYVDVGPLPSGSWVSRDLVVDDGPNRGVYTLVALGPGPLDGQLDRGLPLFFTESRAPAPLPSPRIVQHGVRFRPVRTNIAPSTLQVSSSLLFTAVPSATAEGTTRTVAVDGDASAVEVGDLLRIFTTSRTSPSDEREIVATENGTLLDLAAPVADTLSLPLGSQSLPFALIERSSAAQLRALLLDLARWLAFLPTNYFIELDRRINQALRDPTPVHRADAKTWLKGSSSSRGLGNILTVAGANAVSSAAADSLERMCDRTVRIAQEAQAVLAALAEQQLFRARDLLLRGDFAGFFGAEPPTYGGNMLAAARAVLVEDLPAGKTGGTKRLGRVLAEADEEDAEYEKEEDENPPPHQQRVSLGD